MNFKTGIYCLIVAAILNIGIYCKEQSDNKEVTTLDTTHILVTHPIDPNYTTYANASVIVIVRGELVGWDTVQYDSVVYVARKYPVSRIGFADGTYALVTEPQEKIIKVKGE